MCVHICLASCEFGFYASHVLEIEDGTPPMYIYNCDAMTMATIPLQICWALIDYILTLLQILLVLLVKLAENQKPSRKELISYHTSILSGH